MPKKILKTYLLPFFALAMVTSAFGEDAALVAQIKNWKKGDEPPRKLLHFPDGKIDENLVICAIGDPAFNNAIELEGYLEQVQNDELLAALIADPRSDSATFQAAVGRLIRWKGVGRLAAILNDRAPMRKREMGSPAIASLVQILQSPFIELKVAFVGKDAMATPRATDCLNRLRDELQKGMEWREAYGLVSAENPDVVQSKRSFPHQEITLVTYLFDSWISEIGFDLLRSQMQDRIPRAHLKELISKGVGVYVRAGDDGVYLYAVEAKYTPSSR